MVCMNILWISNIVFPEAHALLHNKAAGGSSGGWMLGAAQALIGHKEVNLTIASVSRDVSKLTFLKGKNINYYLLPCGKGNTSINHDYEPLWKEVKEQIRPDVVHLHGTEYSHGLAYIEACGAENVCVSIQGLTSVISFYHFAGLSKKDIILANTPYSLLCGGIMDDYRFLVRRGKYEKILIRKVQHIIGRTEWDRCHTWAINPDAQYYHGGETLRCEFYSSELWRYENCIPHSIFISQGTKPIKGLHQVIKALPLVLRHYPDARIIVAGNDIIKSTTIRQKFSLGGYGNLLRKLIMKYNLNDKVVFTGPLDAEGMRKEYLKSNVFVCPSSIENSPNSLGEAQLLGVPVLASYVGGTPEMMKGDEEHLYRFDDIQMLAYKLVSLFNMDGNFDNREMRERALFRHNPEKNAKELINIYKCVCKK